MSLPGLPAAAADPPISTRLARSLQAVIDEARQAKVVPGISAAVSTPGDIWTGVSGKATIRHAGQASSPVEPDTPFAIGSVTKTFVATVVLLLREEGKLSLDDHLSRWETRVPNAKRITVRQLLSHTSGIRDMWWHPKYRQRVEGRPGHVWRYSEVRAMIGAPRFSPGAGWEYSNSNYVLLGRIVQLVTGHSVAAEIRTRLLDPLGLADTWYQGLEKGPRAVAMGYLRRSGRWVPQGSGKGLRPTTSIATFFGSAGAMVSTARDLAVWARALYGGQVLSAGSLRQMTRFNGHGYGLGARRKEMGGREAWGHGGSLDGFETSMWYLPRLDTAVVLVWNRRGLESDWTTRRLARRVVDALDPDVTPPISGGSRIAIRTGATVEAGSVPVVVSWSVAHDSQGLVASYHLRRRTDGGAWQPVRLASPGALSAYLKLPTGRMTELALRATDDRGNDSAWVQSAAVVPRFIDENDPSIEADVSWHSRPATDALGGRILSSEVSGSQLSFGAQVMSLALVAPRGRSLTDASLRVDDGHAMRVALGSRSREGRQTVASWRWGGAARDHSVRVSVASAPSPRVDVDGFVVLEAVPAAP